jgi:alpha-galactosidase
MLAIGRLEPTPGWGQPRASRLTHDEQRTLLTLWSIFRSPLIMGGNLLLCDDRTKSLLTNEEVIAVDQHSRGNHAALTNGKAAVWVAEPESGPGHYVAVFNRADEAQTLHFSWQELGLNEQAYTVRDLWEHKELGHASALEVRLAAHASALYKIIPVSPR